MHDDGAPTAAPALGLLISPNPTGGQHAKRLRLSADDPDMGHTGMIRNVRPRCSNCSEIGVAKAAPQSQHGQQQAPLLCGKCKGLQRSDSPAPGGQQKRPRLGEAATKAPKPQHPGHPTLTTARSAPTSRSTGSGALGEPRRAKSEPRHGPCTACGSTTSSSNTWRRIPSQGGAVVCNACHSRCVRWQVPCKPPGGRVGGTVLLLVAHCTAEPHNSARRERYGSYCSR